MSQKENILLVANWESDVGYAWWLMENFWTVISDHFKEHGRKCYLIYPKITQVPESIASSDIEVTELDFRDRSVANIRKLHRYIKINSIIYIYLTDSPSHSLFYLLLRLWGIKKIAVHDHTPGARTVPRHPKRLLKSLLQRIPLYTADHFIAVTDFVYDRLITAGCISPQKCSVAPNGIQPAVLENCDPKYAHKLFHIPDDRTIVITTGRATYYKGIDFFIECASELVNKEGFRDLHFLYCGDGPDMNNFQKYANHLKIGEYFTFAGKRSDVLDILPSCKIGFHAATGEVGYSLSILEYMSAGLVTIVPDRPSTSLATEDMVNGLLYEPRNVQSATNAIKNALDEELATLIRRNAISTVKSKYDIRSTNEQLLQIVNAVFTT